MQWKSTDLILVGEPERDSGDGECCLVDGEVVDAPVAEEARENLSVMIRFHSSKQETDATLKVHVAIVCFSSVSEVYCKRSIFMLQKLIGMLHML